MVGYDEDEDLVRFGHLLGRLRRNMQVWLQCDNTQEFSVFIPILHLGLPNLQGLWLVPPFDEAVIDILGTPVEESEAGESGWLLPNLVDLHVRDTREGQTFDRLLELVDARAASEVVQSLARIRLQNGIISERVLTELKQKVDCVTQVNVRVV